MRKVAVTLAGAFFAWSAPAQIASAENFYEGRNVDFIIGGNPGAGYDTYARTLMRHLGRHIPGSPSFIARNMPGAGGAIASAWLANIAPRDGSAIGAIYPGAIINPLLQPDRKFNYDPAAFNYLGSADATVSVCATYHTSPVKTYEDARRTGAIFGGSPGAPAEYAFLHRRAGGLKIDIVPGYKGTTDILMAMERGEVAGFCGVSWSSLNAQRPDWIRDRKFNFIAHDAVEADAELTKLGAPNSLALIKDPLDRAAAELIFSQQVFGRP
jgi:tripartite-type tricarboxylate transporter receptor subunit TctC